MCYTNQANKTQLSWTSGDDMNEFLIDSSAPNTSHPSRYIMIPPYADSGANDSNITYDLNVIDTDILYGTKNITLPRPVAALRAKRDIQAGEVLYCHKDF